MAVTTVAESPNIYRTKVITSGIRVRLAKPGETAEQQRSWQDKLVQRGIGSIVFPSLELMNKWLSGVKEMAKREALRDKLERQWQAGELMARNSK